jgi:hypothetical protein
MKNTILFLVVILLLSCTEQYVTQTIPIAEVCTLKNINTVSRSYSNKSVNYDVIISSLYSNYVVLLDFNGYYVDSTIWNTSSGQSVINCTSSGLTSQEIKAVIDSMRKDFNGFNIALTTNENVYKKYPTNKRIRLIITENSWKPKVGGISFVGSIKWGDETPAFVFSKALNYNVKYIAETCSHEIGHTISLSHQVVCTNGVVTNSYRVGTIMGNSLNTPNAYWTIGPIAANCFVNVDEIAQIVNFLQ